MTKRGEGYRFPVMAVLLDDKNAILGAGVLKSADHRLTIIAREAGSVVAVAFRWTGGGYSSLAVKPRPVAPKDRVPLGRLPQES